MPRHLARDACGSLQVPGQASEAFVGVFDGEQGRQSGMLAVLSKLSDARSQVIDWAGILLSSWFARLLHAASWRTLVGHGGYAVADWLQRKLPAVVAKSWRPSAPENSLTDAFLEADSSLLTPKSGFMGLGERGVGGSKCGATAAVAVLYEDGAAGSTKLATANIGDARIVLIRNGQVTPPALCVWAIEARALHADLVKHAIFGEQGAVGRAHTRSLLYPPPPPPPPWPFPHPTPPHPTPRTPQHTAASTAMLFAPPPHTAHHNTPLPSPPKQRAIICCCAVAPAAGTADG